MTRDEQRAWLDGWKLPKKKRAKPIPEDPPTRPRTMRMKPTHINVVVCRRCLGAKYVLFQWFGQQVCPECNGTGEFDE